MEQLNQIKFIKQGYIKMVKGKGIKGPFIEMCMLNTPWNFFVHSTTRNAPYKQPRHDSIVEL